MTDALHLSASQAKEMVLRDGILPQGTIVGESLDLDDCIFKDTVTLDGVTFVGGLSLKGATVKGDLELNGILIEYDGLDLEDAIISGELVIGSLPGRPVKINGFVNLSTGTFNLEVQHFLLN